MTITDIKWKTWEEQGELKQEIRDYIDTGNNRNNIVNEISRDFPDKWTRKEIHRAITELKKDLLIAHCGHDYYKVTSWAHDALLSATGCRSHEKALMKLKEARVYHKDMATFGTLKTEEEKECERTERVERKQREKLEWEYEEDPDFGELEVFGSAAEATNALKKSLAAKPIVQSAYLHWRMSKGDKCPTSQKA